MEIYEETKAWERSKYSMNLSEKVEKGAFEYTERRKMAIYVMAVLECFLFSCILFGWSSLEYVYKEEGVYADLCQPSHNQTDNRYVYYMKFLIISKF